MVHQESGRLLAAKVSHFKRSVDRARGLLIYSEAPVSFAAVFHLPLRGFFPLVHTLGMKFPIDIFFCSSNKEVRHIFRQVRPGAWVAPWKNILGGCPFLIEFSNCDTSSVSQGDRLEW